MDIPFNLSFTTNTGSVLEVSRFAESYKQLIENAEYFSIEVKENCDLTVLFERKSVGDVDWKLKIDIMDGLPENCFTNEELQDEEDPVFYPSDRKRPLYLDSRSKIKGPDNIIYPMLIPGSYKITINESNRIYYAFLKVIPLRIDDNQLNFMRREVETYLNGLAMDMNKNSNMNFYNGENNNNILYKTNLFMENYTHLISAINRILNNPKVFVEKEYCINKTANKGKVDSRTIRYRQRRTDMHDKLLTYSNTINYDTRENKNLKFIIYCFREELTVCLKFLEENMVRHDLEFSEKERYLRSGQREVMLSSLQEQCKYNRIIYNNLEMIFSACNKLIYEEWMEQIGSVNYLNSPSLLARSKYYNVIYKVYMSIKSQISIDTNPLANYKHFWKESSKLYEIWGFLKLKEAIIQSEYNLKPQTGWIYSIKSRDVLGEMPFLDPDTQIIFENKEGLRIILYYDSIMLESKETHEGNPVYPIGKHNRPDFRLDVYTGGDYKQSIIGDFKYRAYRSLGNFNSYLKGDTSAYKQLLEYSNIRVLDKSNSRRESRSKEAAYEAWVFYPESTDVSIERSNPFDSETNIRRIELSPGKSDNKNYLFRILDETIKDILEG